ncbi:hypothetical protein [Riemerella columbipharyngis]|uniref:Uncharacterized protein n=1 Tax=Riemerella columbipharyngis TaxID=1071918 RepID=A0A1G7FDM5_9FLAO|nr:hypothetical protein [Riemerella columbipharyngis]SDE73980.1 hypothetical protein SAMN05421544_1223 [Riemerella columbipharyngis]
MKKLLKRLFTPLIREVVREEIKNLNLLAGHKLEEVVSNVLSSAIFEKTDYQSSN